MICVSGNVICVSDNAICVVRGVIHVVESRHTDTAHDVAKAVVEHQTARRIAMRTMDRIMTHLAFVIFACLRAFLFSTRTNLCIHVCGGCRHCG